MKTILEPQTTIKVNDRRQDYILKIAIYHTVQRMSRRVWLMRCFFLFLLVFALQQIISIFAYTQSLPEHLQPFIHLATQISFACIPIILMKVEGSGLREHGLLIPKAAGRHFSMSILLAVLYILITVFLLGSITGVEASPTIPISFNLFLTAVSILLASIATEIIFRGYIQTKLTNAYGFFPALLISSVMSTLYMFSLPLYAEVNSTPLFYVLSLFAESIFLAIFFKKTKTLLCPITYSASASLLYAVTPLKPIAAEYTSMILVLVYIFLTPIMQLFWIDEEEMVES